MRGRSDSRPRHRSVLRLVLACEDWDAAGEEEPPRAENPRLSATVGELLALTGAASNSSLTVVESAVIQTADWWARHALPVPASVDGPRLPGVIPGEQLESCDRLSVQIPDPTLLSLVAGPHPGRCRGRQVAWRRGLTFWVAARLASPDALPTPARDRPLVAHPTERYGAPFRGRACVLPERPADGRHLIAIRRRMRGTELATLY